MPKERPKLACCVELCGSTTVGVLMYRLDFWAPKAAIKRGNRKWFAKSYEDLMWETGLSHQQVKDALSRLRRLGFIATEQAKFKGVKTLHILVTEAFSAAIAATLVSGPNDPDGNGSNDPLVSGSPDPVLIDQSKIDPMEDMHGGHACSSELMLATGIAGDSSGSGGLSMKVADVIAGAKMKVPEAKQRSLSSAWPKLVSAATEEYVPPLTVKERGQLKLLIGKCPPGKAMAVLEFAIGHWIEFGKRVEHDAGIKSSPGKPRIDFLLKYAGTAVNMLSEDQPTVHVPIKQEAAKKVGPVTLMSPEPEAAPQTMDDLLAILGDKE